jgi:hypothetical protein
MIPWTGLVHLQSIEHQLGCVVLPYELVLASLTLQNYTMIYTFKVASPRRKYFYLLAVAISDCNII